MSMRRTSFKLAGSAVVLGAVCTFAFAGCGSSSTDAPPGGSAGAAGGSAGAGGTGTGGSAGTQAAGTGGSSAGAAGHGAGGSAGHGGSSAGGSAGTGGSAGSGGAHAGSGGSAGTPGATCAVDADCVKLLPVTQPVMCADAKCDPKAKTCLFTSKDRDKDGHGTNFCKALDGTPIVVGDDCDDTDPSTHPGAWDGPKGDGHPDSCDNIDQNCDGIADDDKLKDGTSCKCTPGDVQPCSEDSMGQPITWPTGKPQTPCKYGAKTCLSNGSFGPCTGAHVAMPEVCNQVDDDCNGIVDDGPPPDKVPVDAVYFAYDGDNDQHGLIPGNGYALVHACTFNQPKTAPAACTAGPFTGCTLGTTAAECCPDNGWKFAASLVSDDCNDQDPKVNPIAPDVCDGIDNNCDGTVDPGCMCTDGMTQACGSAAQCNDGGTQSCTSGMYGTCDIPPALNAGADCGNGLGACAWPASAQETCTGPSTGGTVCKYESDVGAGATTFQDHAFPGNGSWDWNCDGVEEPEIKDTDKVYYGHSGLFGCGTAKFFESICNQQGMVPKYCDAPTYYGVCYPPPMGTGCGLPGYPDCTVPGCGYEYMWTVKCAVASDGTCHYASDTPYMQHCR